jgi:hypothetical protein
MNLPGGDPGVRHCVTPKICMASALLSICTTQPRLAGSDRPGN